MTERLLGILLVFVDGGKAVIPPPSTKTGNVERYKYCIAKIHNNLNSVDEYTERSGVTLACS